MAKGATIRKLKPSDRAAWEKLWQGYLEFYESSVPPKVTEHTWERLLGDRALHGRLAEKDGVPIGLVHFTFHPSTWSPTSYCYLEDLYVTGAARGTGAGRALIEAVYEAADAASATRVYWVTHETNETAQRLYDRIANKPGFIQYRRR